jgi:hypothetical protein
VLPLSVTGNESRFRLVLAKLLDARLNECWRTERENRSLGWWTAHFSRALLLLCYFV